MIFYIFFLLILLISFIIYKNNTKAIVIGSGLAGLSTAITILENGGNVILVEKQSSLGGNSSKASSGINAAHSENQKSNNIHDSLKDFTKDTLKSTQYNNQSYRTLINQLVGNSKNAIEWLESKDVNLNSVAILGGHTNARTHRPNTNTLVGIEIISKLTNHLNSYYNLTIYKSTQLESFIQNKNKTIIGINCKKNNRKIKLYGNVVILATGGFGNNTNYIKLLPNILQKKPELFLNNSLNELIPTTNSSATTGDGILLGKLINAATIDLDDIQVHPTGFIDPNDQYNRTKILCGEVLRGVGAILLDTQFKRFCNELDTRQNIVNSMNSYNDKRFIILLSDESANQISSHIQHYVNNNLLTKVKDIYKYLQTNNINKITLTNNNQIFNELNKYNNDVKNKKDSFGKIRFPAIIDPTKPVYIGWVTPVIHYCMGGLKINEKCQVIDNQGNYIERLYAVGEVTGGIHGKNRLGGNSLLECTVYGRIAGEQAMQYLNSSFNFSFMNSAYLSFSKIWNSFSWNIFVGSKKITKEELSKHNKAGDVWIAIDNNVYDVSDYVDKHPGGSESIMRYAGMDATSAFYQIHEKYMLNSLKNKIVGKLI